MTEERTNFDRVGEGLSDIANGVLIVAVLMGSMLMVGVAAWLAFFGQQLLEQGISL